MAAARSTAPVALLLTLASLATPVAGMTCGALKEHYRTEQCCGQPEKEMSKTPGAADCPYNFNKPACEDAEPQTPRDLTPGAVGEMDPKAPVLGVSQAEMLPLVNVHFHLGAEHKSEAYLDDTDSKAYDASHPGRRLAADPRPGFMCSKSDLDDAQKTPYVFKHCKGDVAVGKSYEVHYVRSSAGYSAEDLEGIDDVDGIDDGLGGAANGRGLLNPMILVQGQVFQIVQGAADVMGTKMLHSWTVTDHTDSVMYAGSTTGTSHDNQVCSPYFISWHVDKKCHQVSPESFDNLCKQMKDLYNLESDLYPHGSRKIVDPQYVVKSEFVYPLE